MFFQSAIERRFADRSRCFELPMRPMHRIKETEALGNPVMKVTAVSLERMEASNIKVGKIKGWLAFYDPLCQSLADTLRAKDTLRIHTGGDV